MPFPKHPVRLTGACMLLFAVGLGLTACVAGPTGRSAAATDHQIESIPGVERATLRATTLNDGLTNHQTINLTVAVSDGYQIGDADAAIVWLAREAWSAGPRRPGSMGISLEDSSGKPVNWDWKAALAKRGWDVAIVDGNMSSANVLVFANSRMTSLTGNTWPGPVPKTPANLFVKN